MKCFESNCGQVTVTEGLLSEEDVPSPVIVLCSQQHKEAALMWTFIHSLATLVVLYGVMGEMEPIPADTGREEADTHITGILYGQFRVNLPNMHVFGEWGEAGEP